MKWKWECRQCGAESKQFGKFYKMSHAGRRHSNIFHNGNISLFMIREDGVVREELNYKKIVIDVKTGDILEK